MFITDRNGPTRRVSGNNIEQFFRMIFPSLSCFWRASFGSLLAMGASGPAFAAIASNESVASSHEEIAEYARRVEAELRGDILPFWLAHTRDRKRGGFFGEISDDLMINRDAPRGALLTTRVLWTFSAAYERYHDPAYLEMARWAYADLVAHFLDPENGGLFWMTSAEGNPLDPRKLLYVQSFGVYALSEFHRATGKQEPLDRAIALYRLIEEHAKDRTHGGYFEEFARDWKISRARGRGSPMGSADQKSQNVHLHLLEAYTNLLRVWPDDGLRKNLRELIAVMRARVFDEKTHHLRLFLAEDWTPRSNTISFGHDIEFAWLYVEAAEVLGDESVIAASRAEAVQIARVTLEQGVDRDGGVFAEAGPKGVTNSFKEWWPQAEATVGFFNAFQISGDPKYLDASRQNWKFIDEHLIDHERGEWFQGVTRNGQKSGAPKVSLWKCPYHDGRACLELLRRMNAKKEPPNDAKGANKK
jgi:mannobiose 2-epimerase